MMPGRAFVTGATGLVGAALVERLAGAGREVVALARPGSDCSCLEQRGVAVVRGDLSRSGALAESIRGCDVVFHCAAPTGLSHTIEAYHAGIAEGTASLLRAAREAGASRFVYVSSVMVYELRGRSGECDEKQPLLGSSIDPYGRAKCVAEAGCMDAHRPGVFDVAIVRPGFIYGPAHRREGFLQDMAAMMAGGKFRFIGDGGNAIPLIHVADVVELLLRSAGRGEACGRVYNACAPARTTWRELAQALCDGLGLAMPPATPVAPVLAAAGLLEALARLGLLRRLPLSTAAVRMLASDCRFSGARAARERGFVPGVTFDEGIRGCMPSLREVLAGRAGS